MKKLMAILLAMMVMNIALAASGEVITINPETASVEEITEAIDSLKAALNKKVGKESGEYTFENGYSISVLKAEKKDDKVTVHFRYSHQEDEPSTFLIYVYSAFQNGIELFNKQTSDDFQLVGRKTLKNSPIEVTVTYELIDDSPITVYVWPRYGNIGPFVATISLE